MISVVIPVFNDVRVLRRCLASVAEQTARDVEVIVVDDGSHPPIPSTPDAYPPVPFPMRFLHQEHAGAAAARNTGAAVADGEYLLFCDADIVLIPDALATLRSALEAHPEASYAYPSFRFGWKRFASFPFDAERLRRMPYIHTTALLRRAHFPGFDASLPRFQDWDLWLTLLAASRTGLHVPAELFAIRRMRGTMSRWVPSFAHRLPWKIARVRAYDAAAARIRAKHHLA